MIPNSIYFFIHSSILVEEELVLISKIYEQEVKFIDMKLTCCPPH